MTERPNSRESMDQYFTILAPWRVVISKHRQHAMWPQSIAGHLRGTRAVKGKVAQQAAVFQDPADVQLIQALEEPIPGLKVYEKALTCKVEPGCSSTALALQTMMNQCSRDHRGARQRPLNY
ncbi:MAG: hypothetical protein HETSPECPRED_006864 [Heterodermia speciosa]|uniref:Uncharacterized protein n=1 Tax=Heterodermia speciosa TaxID=116794 RepID=A0A8H3FVG0_9LECA|nr:MAG: hypothetical protein HETSPECPRED_006864 [Heterodermia speciosa]